MRIKTKSFLFAAILLLLFENHSLINAKEKPSHYLQPIDIFQMEYVSSPQISPDGSKIVYLRNFFDIMTDKRYTDLWIINFNGTENRPLTTGKRNDFSPVWSPDGKKLLYASTEEGSAQLYLRWMDTGQTAKLTNLTKSPRGFTWSPDGKMIAFSMFVPAQPKRFISLPPKPKGAKWAEPAKVIDKLIYRSDGAGYLPDGFSQLFVLPAEGGTPRQITFGNFQHNSAPVWSRDGKALIFSANRHPGWEYDPQNSEIYRVSLQNGAIVSLTDRKGPDAGPTVSPNGKKIAYIGYDDKLQGYQVRKLYVMNADGSGKKLLSAELDRDVNRPVWSSDSKGVFFQYDDRGNTKIGYYSLNGNMKTLAKDVGGLSLGRPYSAGSFSVARNGHFVFTQTRPDHPADLAAGSNGSKEMKRLTHLNDDLFSFKKLGTVADIRFKSSYDGREIQGWIVKPPDFDADKKYPLILEIHGGPFANYGDRFSAEIQMYAAAGYVVLYTNPRGSTGYGGEFGNLIHHNYPGQDYDDLMSGVDAVIAKGCIDSDNLFVTGGSGGGVLTSWIVGKTGRFRAAVAAKPVINWYSFVLTSDHYNVYYKYWFPGFPWDYPEQYMKRSPISYAGNVTTPTMLLTGEADHRTPISESEQFYQALKLRKVDAVMVRIPNASHSITARPSNLMTKVSYILAWFEKYRINKNLN